MTITKTVNGEETILKIEGWLDTQSAPEVEKEVKELDEATKSLVMDLSGLEYIASSGVRQVVAAYKKMKGQFKVVGATEAIMSIFKATGLDKKIHFE